MFKTVSRTVLQAALIGMIASPAIAQGKEKSSNRGLQSVHQPVVSYSTFLFDVSTDGNGLSRAEQARLTGWLDSLDIGYGDSIAIATNGASVARSVQGDIADVIGRRGLLVHEDSSAAAGIAPYGSVRLIVRRTSASVPGCPDWKTNQENNMAGGTSSNFGCGVNGNLAAMVANPEDLVRGQTNNSDLRTATSSRAIKSYREKAPTGDGDLKSLGGN